MKTVVEGFEQYIYTPMRDRTFGDQTLYKFDNGFGASVIFYPGSYGYEEGLLEIAVVKWFGHKCYITYDTYLTDDVLGDLNEAQVKLTLQRIKEL